MLYNITGGFFRYEHSHYLLEFLDIDIEFLKLFYHIFQNMLFIKRIITG